MADTADFCGDFGSGGDSLLFFFLLLVVIFCNCDFFCEDDGDSLLFFFLLLVVLFCNCDCFGGRFGFFGRRRRC